MTMTLLVLAAIAGWAGWMFRRAGVNQAQDAAGGNDDRSVLRRGYAERDKATGALLFLVCGAFLLAAIYFGL